MTRAQLEHIIRASCDIAADDAVVVVGSQSILGQFPDAPAELCVSKEADVFPRNRRDRAKLIEGSIGELSMFHDTFGYYADGIDDPFPTLPAGWEDRLIEVRNENTRGYTGWCLDVHDLLISKYVAGRDKDLAFTSAAARHGLCRRDVLLDRLAATDVDAATRDLVRGRIERDHAA